MEAEVCLGAGSCSLGGLAPGERHRNGGSVECEQLLCCSVCESGGGGLGGEERGSPNMLRNPSGEEGLEGWVKLSSLAWEVQRSAVPLRAQTNFVSSFWWCSMAQVVYLGAYVRNPGEALVEVAAGYMARFDCQSSFRMEAVLFDGGGAQLERWDSGVLNAPRNGWEKMRHVFEPLRGAKFVLVVIHGKDKQFWAVLYGAKVAEVSVRVLFDASVERSGEGVLREGAFERRLGVEAWSQELVVGTYLREAERMEEAEGMREVERTRSRWRLRFMRRWSGAPI